MAKRQCHVSHVKSYSVGCLLGLLNFMKEGRTGSFWLLEAGLGLEVCPPNPGSSFSKPLSTFPYSALRPDVL